RTRSACSRVRTRCWCTRTVPPWASSPGTTCWPAWPEADPVRRTDPLGAPEVRGGVAVLAPVAVLIAAVTGCASVDDEISFGSHGTPFSIAYAEVADDWKLVTGGEPERELGIDQWEVLGDVVATNIGDEAREIHLEF